MLLNSRCGQSGVTSLVVEGQVAQPHQVAVVFLNNTTISLRVLASFLVANYPPQHQVGLSPVQTLQVLQAMVRGHLSRLLAKIGSQVTLLVIQVKRQSLKEDIFFSPIW